MPRNIPVRRTTLADMDRHNDVQHLSPDEAWPNRISVRIGELDVPVIGRNEFVRNKRATGREKDLGDLRLLPSE